MALLVSYSDSYDNGKILLRPWLLNNGQIVTSSIYTLKIVSDLLFNQCQIHFLTNKKFNIDKTIFIHSYNVTIHKF